MYGWQPTEVQRRQKWPTQAVDFGSSDAWKKCSLASAAICVVDANSLVTAQKFRY